MKMLCLLGSTGSIGTSTLDVVRRHPDEYRIHSLIAGYNARALASQIQEFRPRVAVMATAEARDEVSRLLSESGLPGPEWPSLEFGDAARVACAVAPEVDTVLSAIVGVEGLRATYAAICAGKRMALANKEVLVSAGKVVTEAARRHGVEILPVDSEHNGAHQCLRGGRSREVRRLILTASGGPFRNTPAEQLAAVTPEQALNHPTWKMGRRITIDSATLMNKGFEVIEACWLFDLAPSQIDVVVHPQSSVHAMVEFSDGSILAQISATDMRMPIQYALTYPDRCEAPVPRVDWAQARQWEFFPPDFDRFPLLRLAYDCMEAGGAATCTLNAADEIAVEAFLNQRIGFSEVYAVVAETLNKMPARTPASIDEILEIDRASRVQARLLVAARLARGVAV
jgi:1-deoxy-D-xylulose-5-phosphate reductoisomerase